MDQNTPFGELSGELDNSSLSFNDRSTIDQEQIYHYSKDFLTWFETTSYPVSSMHAYYIGWKAAQRHVD